MSKDLVLITKDQISYSKAKFSLYYTLEVKTYFGWVAVNFDYFGTPEGFNKWNFCHKVYKERGTTLSRKLEHALEYLRKRHPDTEFRAVQKTIELTNNYLKL